MRVSDLIRKLIDKNLDADVYFGIQGSMEHSFSVCSVREFLTEVHGSESEADADISDMGYDPDAVIITYFG